MKTLMMMMIMMLLVQVAAAHEIIDSWELKWELTLITPDKMIDMPTKHYSFPICVQHGITVMMTPDTRREAVLGFVCEKEDNDESTG